MRTLAIAAIALVLAGMAPASAQSVDGDMIELDLALWRHQPAEPFDLVDSEAALLEATAAPGIFDLAMERRASVDMGAVAGGEHRHSPTQPRIDAMGRRSSQ